MTEPATIALAGVGDFGRYLVEEISGDERYAVAILTRKTEWVSANPRVTIYHTDYSEASVLSILDSTSATALVSTLQCADASYTPLHQGLLNACARSTKCKRFIPSEWAGNIEDYPSLPRAYGRSRALFREILKADSQGVEWTLVNHGCFMDYFVGDQRSYMKCMPGDSPVDLKSWEYVVRGSGDEPQSWTCARDVAKAVVELLSADEWEPVIYICGQWGTYNGIAELVEQFHDRPLKRYLRSAKDIKKLLQENSEAHGSDALASAEAEEWQISGAAACPEKKTRRQHEKYFIKLQLLSVQQLLEKASKTGTV